VTFSSVRTVLSNIFRNNFKLNNNNYSNILILRIIDNNKTDCVPAHKL